MLNPFPQLLVFGFFAPTLLRVAVAVAFGLMAARFVKNRNDFAKTPLPIVGAPGMAVTYVLAVIYAGLAAMFLFGWGTQYAAILGGIASVKHAWFAGHYPTYSPRSRSVYVFMAVICASLLISGAGAYAMDLPL